ncbi:hypothetical protein EHI8A_028940 [Entamoeba histolytica HM-1:IMSS-B]|uniref:Uncharacterized protein n=6 Tax=Entamoeba histolytica TaxID=5759 RepID=C4LU57_ENTH1|nr:hypothetical protein EHI_068670 [Entamoeba histolytica HM-1:IMSS]EMD46691.1 Hypothetical protein EHI5A_024520 [Entamoeba histolytica KU27]EMH73292.1 hypothetical protein EHI8A_028940 [Entamoeba histolytica HM-1:IMSS-B]EMS11881.1 hypothetical protein KM1_066920 [Entamoeba histolytica HM-3:IMSS]ENY60293.1 hypothetical protein EHI7A_031590 [Entamoeba histolytica HM-1:IMSS-A]GAT92128.1 hypothetical protein CL6EHI_068670 [Entamoeba histolytica]|eukprot:XP_650507.1 hypothetical protein EHI_068670 [Entamoeba histolytica HM-1:IMSS]
MKILTFCKVILLSILCFIIYIPTYFVYGQSEPEVQILHTSITFVVCFIICCIVAYKFCDKTEKPTRVNEVPLKSSKSNYIQHLPKVTPIPKTSIVPGNSNTYDIQKKEQHLLLKIQEKENALKFESDPQVQADRRVEIQKLEFELDGIRQAMKMKNDQARKRVSTA